MMWAITEAGLIASFVKLQNVEFDIKKEATNFRLCNIIDSWLIYFRIDKQLQIGYQAINRAKIRFLILHIVFFFSF